MSIPTVVGQAALNAEGANSLGPYMLWGILLTFLLLSGLGITLLLVRCLIKANGDEAIIRTGAGGTHISFTKMVVIPILHQFQIICISQQKLRYERTKTNPLRFKCGTTAELTADLIVRINQDQMDVKMALAELGAERINNIDALTAHHFSMFNDSLESIAGNTEFVRFFNDKDVFRALLQKHIGLTLSGMTVCDICLYDLKEI